tara:strand:- start:22775 stop:22957 length:183 start_codon:yes stop_codon:yes gene_type:complete
VAGCAEDSHRLTAATCAATRHNLKAAQYSLVWKQPYSFVLAGSGIAAYSKGAQRDGWARV